jgi:hypothetical protein
LIKRMEMLEKFDGSWVYLAKDGRVRQYTQTAAQ